jgi:hypothetical protein
MGPEIWFAQVAHKCMSAPSFLPSSQQAEVH